jgi:hypothetical protein
MPPESVSLSDIVAQLVAATTLGTISWEVDPDDDESFRAKLGVGVVLLARGISYSPEVLNGMLALELIDSKGRTVLKSNQVFADDSLKNLYEMARSQALDLDTTISAMLADIKLRSGT